VIIDTQLIITNPTEKTAPEYLTWGRFCVLIQSGNPAHQKKKGATMLPVVEVLNDFTSSSPEIGAEGLSHATIYEKWGNTWEEFPHAEQDVYEALDIYTTERTNSTDKPSAVVITTTGWAAPLGKNGEVEGRPSEHAQRIRCVVRFAMELDNGGFVSRVTLHRPEGLEVQDDFGSATGSLADALNVVAVTLWGREWTRNLLTWWGATDKDAISQDVKTAIATRLQHLVSTVYKSSMEEGE
jgi:hypothetical protein